MTRDELIAACRAIIAADEAATPGPWKIVSDFLGESIQDTKNRYICNHPHSRLDAMVVLATRNTAPAVARAVLEMLGVEDDAT